MNESPQAIREESRWPPALAILAVLGLLAMLPQHVQALPVWVSYVAASAVLVPMAAVTLTRASTLWLRIERMMVLLLAGAYAANTIAQLADMIGLIRLSPPETRASSLLSSSLVIWVSNVLTFSLLYWQIDRGGPHARVSNVSARPDWLFPQAAPEATSPDWRPLFLDYLYLGYNTATGFTPAEVAPLSLRAKMLMMLESAISLLTLVIVAARAVNAIQ
jgi:hypothetical protein